MLEIVGLRILVRGVHYVWTDSYDTLEVVGYGRTPGERKTFAMEKAIEIWKEQENEAPQTGPSGS